MRVSDLMKRSVLLVIIVGFVLALTVGAHTVQGAQAVPKTLTVGVFQEPPFSIKDQTGDWEGISVDLWKEIAKDLNLEYRFRETELDALLEGVADGSIDIIVTPLAITLEEERVVDFSHAFYITGLGIAIPKRSESDRWLSVIRAFLSIEFLQVLSAIVILLFLSGYGVWLFERRRNPEQFSGSRRSGIGSGLWWSSVTFTGVGYGDKVPVTLGGRIIALIWMFSSVTLFSAFTASVTARLAVSHFEQIQNREDLKRYLVAAVEGSAGEEYLQRNHIRVKTFPTLAAAIDAVLRREVDAFVFNETTLKYVVNRENQDTIEILPEVLESQYLAFPLPEGSPLREPVNRILTKTTAQPLWDDIQYHYLGQQAELQPW